MTGRSCTKTLVSQSSGSCSFLVFIKIASILVEADNDLYTSITSLQINAQSLENCPDQRLSQPDNPLQICKI